MTARSSRLRSATVVVGAAHSAGMSPARARIAASSAYVSQAGRARWWLVALTFYSLRVRVYANDFRRGIVAWAIFRRWPRLRLKIIAPVLIPTGRSEQYP